MANRHQDIFDLNRKAVWNSRMVYPSAQEIHRYNDNADDTAPYISGWMNTAPVGRFTEYCIDFKADEAPLYTYWCLANFCLDYPALRNKYAKVTTAYGISGYAGLQQIGNYYNDYNGGNTILSFWDVSCEDTAGNVTVIRPTQVYPAINGDRTFSGEGEGVHNLTYYPWQAGHWYRMLLQCGTSKTTGNTTILQWMQDLDHGVWKHICTYDLGVPNAAFIGNCAVFLEDWLKYTAGDVRTMEVRNIRVRPEKSSAWVSIRTGTFAPNYDHPGSYRYGSDSDTFWIITSGVTGKAGDLQKSTQLSTDSGADQPPYPQEKR